ncbi:hypothetical protein NEMBOFW57_006619 [Staphylotrichum longicolle]|uniref:Uncharacterized protein n=1 Tax=Staphylotrichum longicolle TaxID=669026 RepID=A0AAD4ET80_9PEZI|nr:hypothetical protein NEMBOFW57_006619 [Staphylotrichum longicolle]
MIAMADIVIHLAPGRHGIPKERLRRGLHGTRSVMTGALGPGTHMGTHLGLTKITGDSTSKTPTTLRGIQNMLDKASADSARGPSLRVSRSRPNLAGSDAQILAGASPVTTPVHERPPEPLRDSSRRDTNNDRPPRGPEPIQVVSDSRDTSSRGPPTNGDDYGSSRGEHERSSSRREHHRTDRSSRASGRTSRDRTPDRDRESKDSRDYRDRRSGAAPNVPGSSTREERDSRRSSMREPTGGGREPIPGGGGRDMAPPREASSHRSHRGDGPSGPRGDGVPGGGRSEGGHGGRGEGGGGGRGGEEYGRSGSSRGNGPPRDSRSSRPGDERGDPRGDPRGSGDGRDRKRRSEGAELGSGSHQDKRQRR